MAGLFSKPSVQAAPNPTPPPPPPSYSTAEVQGENARDMLRRRRGMAATVLNGAGGVNNTGNTSASPLLGS